MPHSTAKHTTARTRASAAVYDTIREMAIEYRFRPDEKINEAELAARLGVSRTPVREALNRLLNEGLIHFQKNHGFYCRSLSTADVFFLAETRRDLEVAMIDQVVTRASNEDLAALERFSRGIVDRIDVLPPCELAKADEAFHTKLAELTRNPVTQEMLRNINARIRFIRKIRIENAPSPVAEFRAHLAVIAAVAARDADAARQALSRHLAFSQADAVDALQKGLGKIYLDKINLDVDFAP